MSKRPRPRPIGIRVVGDVIVDRHFYDSGGQGRNPAGQVLAKAEFGGAASVSRLLNELVKSKVNWSRRNRVEVEFGLVMPELSDVPPALNAYAVWAPYPQTSKKDAAKVWRAARPMGYGKVAESPRTQFRPKAVNRATPRVLVLDDGGFDFRQKRMAYLWGVPPANEKGPDWIVLKMSSPVAQGDLWDKLQQDFADRLICIVSADDLRREHVYISTGISWERTLEDVSRALASTRTINLLTTCAHLIITFSIDGALWIDGPGNNQPNATLLFDAAHAEDEWGGSREGKAFGYLSCMAAAVADAAADHVASGDKKLDLARAIGAGLGAMRDLLDQGHGLATTTPDGYPVKRLGGILAQTKNDFATAKVGWPRVGAGEAPWMMISDAPQAPNAPTDARASVISGRARQIVIKGDVALRGVAHAKFGQLTTADRSEIEALRGLRRLMRGYSDGNKPLSIGVFGPPGAGKSFGVRQLAEEVFGPKAWREFNLSQFIGPRDLVGAFHQVRDKVLEGLTPVVFWDEFDSRDRSWLQYLLAPMQDGRFQDDQLSHSIGKCVFVFAGGTYFTFDAFGPKDEADKDKFVRDKGPDFKSRLDGYYNVLGPNQRTRPDEPQIPDPADIYHRLRRALFIRSKLAAGPDDRLDIDPDLLNALLEVDRYNHGARSLEKLALALKSPGRPIRRSLLPPPVQLAIHVDSTKFNTILGRNTFYQLPERIESLARGIHDNWRRHRTRRSSSFNRPYDELNPIQQEDNRAAALRMRDVLALVGLGLVIVEEADPRKRLSDMELAAYLNAHIELLAEAEHEGWVEHRAKNGWRYNQKTDDDLKLHHGMISYGDLPERDKDKDRGGVRDYPGNAKEAGFAIVWL
jgi:hypothetical protein